MTVTASVVVAAEPGQAWTRWADVEAWPEWNPRCVSATLNGPLEPGTNVSLELIGRGERPFHTRPRLTTVTPDQELAWEARSIGLRAPTATRFAADQDGTEVTVEADARGPLAFSYRLALPEDEQALLFVAMLNGLAATFR